MQFYKIRVEEISEKRTFLYINIVFIFGMLSLLLIFCPF